MPLDHLVGLRGPIPALFENAITLVAANAYSKPKHTAACFSRTEWQNPEGAGDEPAPEYHLVGHNAPVVAACFSPKTFRPDSRLLLQLRCHRVPSSS